MCAPISSTPRSISPGATSRAQLHAIKSSQVSINQPGSQIVQQLAAQAGLSVQADTSALMAGKYVNIDYARISDSISLAAVIHKLAEFDGARWWVKIWRPQLPDQQQPGGHLHAQLSAPRARPHAGRFFQT